ncbi:maltokinase N-terminal cap-like domain-containing protein [Nocardioides caldifontis]|uniref:maltokinase N-terminal cap-like domain-containing protein n=1 Tax=Nocardioides caldifontis TaxID=2588938 RepID=UPI0011E02AD4|nr:phosphotransferase [Nocardioides caldifontis]
MTTHPLAERDDQLRTFIENARWFGGKGRRFRVAGVRRLAVPGRSDAATTAPLGLVAVELVTLEYDDGGTDVYQVPTSYYLGERQPLAHALIGTWEDEQFGQVWAYDALHDHAATPLWLHAFADGTTTDELEFHRVGDEPLDRDARSTLLSGEQSNSSVMFGETALMKLFRRITPGTNPDIEILAALTEAGNEHVASLFGWVDARTEDGELLQLGILQQFLRTASDGWELALASLRNLYTTGDIPARESGGDLASEAYRLGEAVAHMHLSLAGAFPVEQWDRDDLARLAETMSGRLERAVRVVPELEEHAAALHAIFDSVRHVPAPVTVQRVHGDLHLGQTLRTVKNWKIIDFEGEPAKPLDERRRPDSPWRDVAGMLRSFDYAAEVSRRDHEQATGDTDSHAQERAREWAARNTTAFLAGYRDATSADVDQVLLTAYATDKAVYEAVYEARNRPGWLSIPLAALARLSSQA